MMSFLIDRRDKENIITASLHCKHLNFMSKFSRLLNSGLKSKQNKLKVNGSINEFKTKNKNM